MQLKHITLTIITIACFMAGPLRAGIMIYSSNCIVCHGEDGEGSIEQRSPSIGSLPAWYVKIQLQKFKHNKRGTAVEDSYGRIMHAIAGTIDEEYYQSLGEYIQSLPGKAPSRTLDGDSEAGKKIYMDACMRCHRYNGSGELTFGSPPLTGLQDWYIYEQSLKYKNGIRGVHKSDAHGFNMREAVRYLTDQQLKDVATYIPDLSKQYSTKE